MCRSTDAPCDAWPLAKKPMNMTMNMTLPYAMQAGDKSTSLLTAFTIVSKGYDLNFGGQIKRKSAVLKKDWNFYNNHFHDEYLYQKLLT